MEKGEILSKRWARSGLVGRGGVPTTSGHSLNKSTQPLDRLDFIVNDIAHTTSDAEAKVVLGERPYKSGRIGIESGPCPGQY